MDEREKAILLGMEQQLRTDDHRFAKRLSQGPRRMLPVLMILLGAAGLGLTLLGVTLGGVLGTVLGVSGFLTMLTAAVRGLPEDERTHVNLDAHEVTRPRT